MSKQGLPKPAQPGDSQIAEDHEAAKREILRAIARYHPDLTGREFEDADHKAAFVTLVAALNSFDQTQGGMPMPQELSLRAPATTGLARQLNASDTEGNLINLRLQSETYTKFEEGLLAENRKKQRRFYAFPKITSAMLASTILVLVSVLGNFREHPVYEQITESAYVEHFRSNDPLLFEHVEIIMSYEESLSPVDFNHVPQSRLLQMLRVRVNDPMPTYNYIRQFKKLDYYISRDLVLATIVDLEAKDKEIQRVVDALSDEKLSPDPGGATESPTIYYKKDLTRYKAILNNFSGELALLHDEANEHADRKLMRLTLCLLLATVTIFVFYWCRENSDRSWVEYLLTSEGMETLENRIRSRSEAGPNYSFSKAEICRIARIKNGSWFKKIFGLRVNLILLQEVVDIIIVRFLAEGIIVCSSRSPNQKTYSYLGNRC